MATDQKINELDGFLKNYSFYDLAKGFFALNLWLPNISSQIKIQYLYVVLETIHRDLATENKILSYADYKSFCEELFQILPSFSILEDYIPESDWGDIKYYFEKNLYKIFYGGDLSNPYDFYYSYEIIHRAFEQKYMDLIQRSSVQEMQFCLEAQDHILENLEQEKTDAIDNISPGDISTPSEDFWKSVCEFIDQYHPEHDYSVEILTFYTKELGEPTSFPDMDVFIDNAYHGQNCRYFFIKKDDRYYPVIPRRWLTVIYDTWGLLLKENYPYILKKLNGKDPRILIGLNLYKFLQKRVDGDQVFPLASPLKDGHEPHELIFTAVHAGDKIFLIYVMPPFYDQDELSKHLEEIQPKLKECNDLVAKAPTRLGLAAEQKIVEFHSVKGEKGLEPIFLIILPSPLSDTEGNIKLPEGIHAEIMTLDQITGIFDEIKKLNELVDFFDYIAAERKLARIPALNSYLDMFGSFKDSYGVLVPGAVEPNMIMLDFGWGSNFRFKSLKEFWEVFPEESFYGHPRSWTIPLDQKTDTGFILSSKTFFGYAYYQRIGDASFFINAPVHIMTLEHGKIADLIMQSLFDAVDIYPHIIEKLEFTKKHNKVQVFFCPVSLVSKSDRLKHLRCLAQNDTFWKMDAARLGTDDYGVRVVYNEKKIIEALKNVQDRSIQISLLLDVLEQLGTLVSEPNLGEIKVELEKEKDKKARFKIFEIAKKVSFPEGVRETLPESREHKLANKEIAKIAFELGIKPGKYSAEKAKEKLNNLRSKVVEALNTKMAEYNLPGSLPLLIEKSNVLISDSQQAEAEIKASLDHEVDYERGTESAEKEKKFLHWYRVYRYLIEKFVQLQPKGKTILESTRLKELLAFINQLLDIYVASDFINYELYPVGVNIDGNYIISTSDEKNDIATMEKEYGEEQAKINLGIIGNKKDTADSSLSVNKYLDDLDKAFKKDFGFGLRNLVNVQQVMALWAVYVKKREDTHYCATAKEISSVCSEQIRGYDPMETEAILEFLTLKPEEMLTVKGDPQPAKDLPIWEHNKRLMRFDIRPLIKIRDQYYWGPHSIDRATHIWVNISSKHRLPSDIDAPKIKAVLNKGHVDLEKSLVKKIEEIISRHTDNIKLHVYPHKYDKTISDIGDCDVLAYLEKKNILLNIESKIIDLPHSYKDSGRVQRKIFGETRKDGTFKKGYLQRVEGRADYLKTKGEDLIKRLGWQVLALGPKVISVFVTKMGFWWTKHSPVETEVRFIETRLLNDLISGL